MKTCEQIQDRLTACALGDLPEAEAAEIRRHMDECEGCRAAAQNIEPTLDLLRDALAAAPADVPLHLGADYRRRIAMAGISSEQSSVISDQSSVSSDQLSVSSDQSSVRDGNRLGSEKREWWIMRRHPAVTAAAAAVMLIGFFGALFAFMPSLSVSRRAARECLKSENRMLGLDLSRDRHDGDLVDFADAEPSPHGPEITTARFSRPGAKGGAIEDLSGAARSGNGRWADTERTTGVWHYDGSTDTEAEPATAPAPEAPPPPPPVEVAEPVAVEFDTVSSIKSPIVTKGLYSVRNKVSGRTEALHDTDGNGVVAQGAVLDDPFADTLGIVVEMPADDAESDDPFADSTTVVVPYSLDVDRDKYFTVNGQTVVNPKYRIRTGPAGKSEVRRSAGDSVALTPRSPDSDAKDRFTLRGMQVAKPKTQAGPADSSELQWFSAGADDGTTALAYRKAPPPAGTPSPKPKPTTATRPEAPALRLSEETVAQKRPAIEAEGEKAREMVTRSYAIVPGVEERVGVISAELGTAPHRTETGLGVRDSGVDPTPAGEAKPPAATPKRPPAPAEPGPPPGMEELRVKLPKPAFVGTPKSIKTPNLEPPGARRYEYGKGRADGSARGGGRGEGTGSVVEGGRVSMDAPDAPDVTQPQWRNYGSTRADFAVDAAKDPTRSEGGGGAGGGGGPVANRNAPKTTDARGWAGVAAKTDAVDKDADWKTTSYSSRAPTPGKRLVPTPPPANEISSVNVAGYNVDALPKDAKPPKIESVPLTGRLFAREDTAGQEGIRREASGSRVNARTTSGKDAVPNTVDPLVEEVAGQEMLRRRAEEEHGLQSLADAEKALKEGDDLFAIRMYEEAEKYVGNRPETAEERKRIDHGYVTSLERWGAELEKRGDREKAGQFQQQAAALRSRLDKEPAAKGKKSVARWYESDFDEANVEAERALKADALARYEKGVKELEASRREMLSQVRRGWNETGRGAIADSREGELKADEELSEYRRLHDVSRMEARASMESAYLGALAKRKDQLSTELMLLENQYPFLKDPNAAVAADVERLDGKNGRGAGTIRDGGKEGGVSVKDQLVDQMPEHEENWSEYRVQLARLKQEDSRLAADLPEGHPSRRNLREKITDTEDKLEVATEVGTQRMRDRHKALRFHIDAIDKAEHKWQKAEREEKETERDRVRRKLKEIKIPEIDFRQANINDVMEFLSEASQEMDGDGDAEGKGIAIEVDKRIAAARPDSTGVDHFAEDPADDAAAAGGGEVPNITFHARYVTLDEALKITTSVAGLKHTIGEDGKIRVMPLDTPESPIVTKTYDVVPGVVERMGTIAAELAAKEPTDQSGDFITIGSTDLSRDRSDWKAYFKTMGVQWPRGSSIQYDPKVGKLIVANTANGLEQFENTLGGFNLTEEPEPEEEPEEDKGFRFKAYGVNPFRDTAQNPFSTFSIDVDTASYTLARNYMSRGLLPPAEAVRTEEFVNFFDYGYKAPEHETFRVFVEAAPSKFGRGLHMLKVGVKGRRLGREEQRPAMLTFLIDTSGSMDQADRLGLVRKSLRLLVGKLGPKDRIAIVQYDSHARLVIEPTAASDKKKILAAIDGMQCGGSTNLEEGMARAYAIAAQHFVPGGENRVLLLSDGVANLGAVAAEDILKKVEAYRKQGITCSVFGFGMGTYDDEMLESLANKGDGNYTFIDSEAEARRVFVDDLSATLNTIATDVKIQIEFRPQRVKRYRQLGYENRQLRDEQFRDDTVDAGEVGSGQSVTALYEMELAAAKSQISDLRSQSGGLRFQDLGVVRVRYRRVDTGEVEEIEQPIRASDLVRSFDKADVRFRLAACVAEFAEILRGSPFAAGSDYVHVADVLRPAALDLGLDDRVQELLRLVSGAGSMGRGE